MKSLFIMASSSLVLYALGNYIVENGETYVDRPTLRDARQYAYVGTAVGSNSNLNVAGKKKA
jgi:hypothetical protein